MDAARFLLFQASHGSKTTLDKAYNKHMTKVLSTLDEEDENRWETYNMIVSSLIKNCNDKCISEIKYRLTDGENPNEILLDIINRNILDCDNLVWLLKKRVEEYLKEDLIRRFYI